MVNVTSITLTLGQQPTLRYEVGCTHVNYTVEMCDLHEAVHALITARQAAGTAVATDGEPDVLSPAVLDKLLGKSDKMGLPTTLHWYVDSCPYMFGVKCKCCVYMQ
jgi:hypothetical protein